MTKEKIEEIIEEIILKIVEEQYSIKPHLSDDLEKVFEVDELDRIEILMEIEDELEISILDKDADKWKTVQDIVDYICKYFDIEESIIEKNIYFCDINSRFELLDL